MRSSLSTRASESSLGDPVAYSASLSARNASAAAGTNSPPSCVSLSVTRMAPRRMPWVVHVRESGQSFARAGLDLQIRAWAALAHGLVTALHHLMRSCQCLRQLSGKLCPMREALVSRRLPVDLFGRRPVVGHLAETFDTDVRKGVSGRLRVDLVGHDTKPR